MTYTTLFTDYNVVQLLYRCHVPNSDDLQCKEPHFWINTRVKPPLLTAVQKSYIDKMANYYLAEVCRSTADMSSTPWDLSIDRPACSANAGTTEIPKIFAAAAAAQGVSLVKETVRNLPLGDFWWDDTVFTDVFSKSPATVCFLNAGFTPIRDLNRVNLPAMYPVKIHWQTMSLPRCSWNPAGTAIDK